jgi:hypothetical protein
MNLPSNVWPATTLRLGDITFNLTQLRSLMIDGQPGNPPPSGDQSVQLAYTLIPVLENLAAGTTASAEIVTYVSYAQAYLAAYPINRPNSDINPSGCTQTNMEENVKQLFLYNCGFSNGSPGK